MSNTPASKPVNGEHPAELRWIPILAGAFVVLVALVALFALTTPRNDQLSEQQRQRAELFAGLGGDFTLTGHTGEPVSLADFRGQVVVIYFGYSSCPDVCPIHLTLLAAAMDRLGTRADRLQPLFISLDPERDTVEALSGYVGYFHERLIGLTGTQDEIDQVARQYAVAHEIVRDPALGDYSVNHTTVFFVVNEDGRVVDLLAPDMTADQLADQLRSHL